MSSLRFLRLAILAGVLFLWQPPCSAQQQNNFQAVVIKTVRDVDRKTPEDEWETAVPLDILGQGYLVRTQAASLALISFPDDSKLIVREQSVVEITGTVEGRTIRERQVNIEEGNLAFDIQKQEEEEFRFTSPTSVASIRGTTGSISIGEGGVFSLRIGEGLAELLNLLTNQSGSVGAGQIGISDSEGNLVVRPMTPEEQNELQMLLSDQPDDVRQIRIMGRDAQGDPKEVRIRWQRNR